MNGTPDFRGHGKVTVQPITIYPQMRFVPCSPLTHPQSTNQARNHGRICTTCHDTPHSHNNFECTWRTWQVINGCSDVLVEVLGDRGRHARTCTGSGSLPAAVTCEMVVRVKD